MMRTDNFDTPEPKEFSFNAQFYINTDYEKRMNMNLCADMSILVQISSEDQKPTVMKKTFDHKIFNY
jgi:hypothetical protein